MEIATIGFTRSSAEHFFGRIASAGVRGVADVRLHNTSQLAGFAKREDLAYFLRLLCRAEYVELPVLAPEEEMLRAYRGGSIDWEQYSALYIDLLATRDVANVLDHAGFSNGLALLCSEDQPEKCHRRLAAEFLQAHWGDVSIRHL
jgi:uncharacterized protein (DUF488 family)